MLLLSPFCLALLRTQQRCWKTLWLWRSSLKSWSNERSKFWIEGSQWGAGIYNSGKRRQRWPDQNLECCRMCFWWQRGWWSTHGCCKELCWLKVDQLQSNILEKSLYQDFIFSLPPTTLPACFHLSSPCGFLVLEGAGEMGTLGKQKMCLCECSSLSCSVGKKTKWRDDQI